MPAWIHDRAEHLLAKNPSMKKETAFALATQQSHATGKTPKGYGTPAGKREAKAKFDKPKKEYVKTPNPGGLETPKLRGRPKEASINPAMLAAVRVEFERIKEANWAGALLKRVSGKAAPTLPGSGAAQAQGIIKQMARGRNYGGAAVDPFVKMRQQVQAGIKKQAVRSPYMLDQVGVEPKIRRLNAFAPKEEHRVVKQAMMPSAGQGLQQAYKNTRSATQRLTKSQKIGVPTMSIPEPKPLNIKLGQFATSEYSGELGGGSPVYTSYIPPFKNPPVKTAGPPSEWTPLTKSTKTKEECVKMSSMLDELCKLNGLGSWLTKKLEESEAPSGYVSQVSQLSGLPEEDVRPYVRNIRPHRFWVPAEQFAKDIKPVWAMKAEVYNPLQQKLTATAAGSPEEAAFLKQHGKSLDRHYNAWIGGQADLRKKYTGGDSIGMWANPEKLKVKTSTVISPTSQLTKAKKIGAPKASPPPGPSIQQIAKPVGFGRPIAAATKVGV